MKTWLKVLLVTLILGIPAFLLGPVFWPPAMGVEPTPMQLPFFIFLSAVEALLFGLGVSFLIFGRPIVRDAKPAQKAQAWISYLAIAWLLVSWWPHDNLHIHNGMNLQGLIYIEYGFHITLIIAALLLAYFFVQRASPSRSGA